MRVLTDVEGLVATRRRAAVTIGAYDGVHLGHRHVLTLLQGMARDQELETVVVTFDRHPATVVRPDSAPMLLTDTEQKLELLAATGVDVAVVLPFDRARADETAEGFVTEILVTALGARLVVVGRDFHFGHGRQGNVALLTEMGGRYGFDTIGVELDDAEGEPVSSTRIRRLVAAGDVRGAARLLGRLHEVRGMVVHGDGRGGSQLGMPTANLAVPAGIAVPGEGVYACWYRRPDGSVHGAAANYGRRPTFYGETGQPVLEAHLLSFAGDLYGEEGHLSFVERLRGEVRFDSAASLVDAMQADVGRAGALLQAEGPPC